MWLVKTFKGSREGPHFRYFRHSQAMRRAGSFRSRGYTVKLRRISRRGWTK